MSVFSKFFGKKESTSRVENTREPEIPQDLFVDNQEPVSQENRKTSLDLFMSEDYSIIGYNDGYNYHSGEILEQKKKSIKADFRQVLDKMICSLEANMYDLRLAMQSINEVSEPLTKKMEVKLNACLVDQRWLIREKEYSAMDEGLIMKHIHEYTDHYLRGMADYYEQKELAISTGLFTT